ncbi:MAG: carboxylate--amine ligase [Chlamydiia bacterium]|nr:carboxylate--amine ligase [Chlamydiia bacterium]
MAKRVLLTAGRSQVTLDLARKFHAGGHEVFVAGTSSLYLSRYSKCVKRAFVVPSPRFEPKAYVAEIVEIVEQEKIDLLLPVWEDGFVIAQDKGLFPSYCSVMVADYPLIQTLHNKWTFSQQMKQMGLNCPETVLLNRPEDLHNIPFDPPYAIKKSYTRAAQDVMRCDSVNDLPALTFDPANPWIAQKWIEGNRYCTYSVCHHGRVTASAIYPVDYAIDGYSCINFRPIEHPEITEQITSFVKKSGYHGQIAFDFIEGPDNRLYTFECNPRATSGVHLFTKKDHFDRAFFDPTCPKIVPQYGTKRQILLGMCLYGWRSPKGKADRQAFWDAVAHTPDVVFDEEDPAPFFAQIFLLPYYLYKSYQWNVTIPGAFTYDLDFVPSSPAEPHTQSPQGCEFSQS